MSSSLMISCLCKAAVTLLLLITPASVRSEFNFEVGSRIHERVSSYITTPTLILSQISRYRANRAFPHDLRAPDRDAFFKLNDAFIETYPEFQSIYYGLEDGTFAGHGFASKIANYREPGHSGYLIIDDDGNDTDGSNTNNSRAAEESMQKYYRGCLNSTTGELIECNMSIGGSYTECINDCEYVKCADDASQTDCTSFSNATQREECELNIKYCIHYQIKQVTANETNKRGYISRGTHCINSYGVPDETPGAIVIQDSNALGNCTFGDGETLVDLGGVTGDFGYCGGEIGEVCNGTLAGMYINRDYDPRWRGWYIATKELQVPNWSPPYPFFTAGQIGITFCLPIYTTDNTNGLNVFEGVLAVDFTFTDITNFLRDNYQGTDTIVVIFERDEPHYTVATSTGSSGVKKVLKSDGVTPCAPEEEDDQDICMAQRASAGEIDEFDEDAIIRASFSNQQDEGFPQDKLVSSTPVGYSNVYASQVKLFSTSTGSEGVTELNWQIMIMMPVITEDSDAIVWGDSLFGVLIVVACVGAMICLVLIGLLVKNQKKREVIVSDWRFLSAFLASCLLLNLSCLSFLGPNTDALCLTREWLVHFFLVLSWSLLFTKAYRMYKLVGNATSFRYVAITHIQAAKMAVPLVLIEVVILLVFTFFDPNKLTEMIYFTGSDITHRLVCSHETPAFFIITLIYEGGLILVGCVLAYKTRNLQSEFNESKQIIFSMYNTAVISTVLIVVGNVALQYQGQQRLLFALGIFWITCFSGCVFVLPRMNLTTRKSTERRTIGQGTSAYANEFSVASIKARSEANMSKASQESFIRRASNESSCEHVTSLKHIPSTNTGERRKTVSFIGGNDCVVAKEQPIAPKNKDIEKSAPDGGLEMNQSEDMNIKSDAAKEEYQMPDSNDVKEESVVAIERLHSEDSADWIPLTV